ncbi:hypothetical protein [Mucilaginibacter sp. CSA2-8R]|uniref:hypothetical protein n=1 Tax=Mucilaginibacter sp. CSA2-8R TaxID=3141542 RepID=UPI00315CE744
MKWLFKLFLSLGVILLCGHSMAYASLWQSSHFIVSHAVRSSTEVKSSIVETRSDLQYFRQYKSSRNRTLVENVEDDNDETVNHRKVQAKGDFLNPHFSAQLYEEVSKNINLTYPSHCLLSVFPTSKLYITFRVFRI